LQVRAPRKDDVPRLAIMTRTKKENNESEYTVTPYRGDWEKGAVETFIKDVAIKGSKTKDAAVLEDTPWFDVPPKGKGNKQTKEVSALLHLKMCWIVCHGCDFYVCQLELVEA
jgi:hypothetical protein